jgi:hypothetical protein
MFVAALCAACTLPATSAGAAKTDLYVALGDSYTAAPLVPNHAGMPAGCARSDQNYPSLGAFRDVSCSAARTTAMTAAQTVPFGANPPQLDALAAATTLVTVGIGGDDVGLIGVASTCIELGAKAPTGTACRDRFAPNGDDHIVAKIADTAPKIAAVIQGIRARAPNARIVVVGYPEVLPPSLDGLLVKTNEMLAATSAGNGAEFADTYVDSVGHDVCMPSGKKWFEGPHPTSPAMALHPNALGERGMAFSVLRLVTAPHAEPPLTGPLLTRPTLSGLARAARATVVGRAARFSYRLDRPARVTVVVRRAASGRLSGGACRAPSRTNRGESSCRRYATVGRMSARGRAGINRLVVRPATYARRTGLFRLTATPKRDGVSGASQRVYFRIAR